MILTGQETREQLVALAGSSGAADEILACAWFLAAKTSFPVDRDGTLQLGPVWYAWATGQLTGTELLELLRTEDWLAGATRCRLCGCTDNVACAGGCTWLYPGLCSRCGL